jgi:hypothetical protein
MKDNTNGVAHVGDEEIKRLLLVYDSKYDSSHLTSDDAEDAIKYSKKITEI